MEEEEEEGEEGREQPFKRHAALGQGPGVWEGGQQP